MSTLTTRLRESLALQRNVAVIALAIFLLGFGEQLWTPYFSKYLAALGASALAIGAFGTLRDFLDAVYQYPGGLLSDRLGERRALILFNLLALAGYAIYLLSPNYLTLFIGLFFVMAWSSFSLPATFAAIGAYLPAEKRTMGFSVQSILKRVPVAIASPIGGILIGGIAVGAFIFPALGIVNGIHVALVLTIVFALATILFQQRAFKESPREPVASLPARRLFRELSSRLKRLLVSDILARFAEGIPEPFIVLFALDHLRASSLDFGLLIAVQTITSMVVYLPVAALSERYGRRPFVLLTFAFFALYPLAIVLSSVNVLLILAFIIGGLREIGEPARKALIVDLAPSERRGQTVGLYYLLRGIAVTPAAFIGGALYVINPAFTFLLAFALGAVGVIVFILS